MTLLEIKNLKTYYDTRAGVVKAVDDVSFNLQKGEVIGLAGESGCGKTTTNLSVMRMIQNPGKIVSGQVLFDATSLLTDKEFEEIQQRQLNPMNLFHLKEEQMRRVRGNKISMIFQGAMNALNPVHRVGNQIHEVLKIHEPEHDPVEGWELSLIHI